MTQILIGICMDTAPWQPAAPWLPSDLKVPACTGGLVHLQENEPQEGDPHRLWKQVQGHLGKESGSMIPRGQSGARAQVKYVSLAPHSPHSVFRGCPEEGQSKSLWSVGSRIRGSLISTKDGNKHRSCLFRKNAAGWTSKPHQQTCFKKPDCHRHLLFSTFDARY